MIELKNEIHINIGLVLTPQLNLSLKLLTMNVLDIETEIKELAIENPVLKIDEDFKTQNRNSYEGKFKEIDDSHFYKDSLEDDDLIETVNSAEESIEEKLFKELSLEMDLDQEDREIAKFIIYNIDEKGFLDIDLERFSEEQNIRFKKIENIKKGIMNLEPLGCASKDLREFLVFQNDVLFNGDNSVRDVLECLFKNKKLPKREIFRKSLGLNNERLNEAFSKIATFMPYPLFSYKTTENCYIEPDVIIKKIDGEYFALLNDSFLNLISIDENIIKQYLKRKDTKDYIKDRYKEARNLILSLTNRNKTLLKIMEVILKKQKTFFEDGILKPLSRKEMAIELGFHISTIARAVANKYVCFEGSIIPLKNFFSHRLSGDISKDYIKNKVKKLIEREDKNNPLDDESIKEFLDKKGIHITRRTVAKYRKELNILNKRERHFALRLL
jgi:RNA polymerase sigma-54 factor